MHPSLVVALESGSRSCQFNIQLCTSADNCHTPGTARHREMETLAAGYNNNNNNNRQPRQQENEGGTKGLNNNKKGVKFYHHPSSPSPTPRPVTFFSFI